MSTDPTVLQTTAEGVLDALLAGAEDAAWTPEGCVVVGEPSVGECDTIKVWVSQIATTQQRNCQIASNVRFSFFIASCIGADIEEDCEWWEERAAEYHDRIWATWVGLVDAVLTDTLCVGVTCADVTLNDLLQVGNQGLWQGSVDVVLSPRSGS